MIDCLRDEPINDGSIVRDAHYPKEALAFAEALKINNTVSKLSLYCKINANYWRRKYTWNWRIVPHEITGTDIGADGARALAEALRTNNTLTSLDIGCLLPPLTALATCRKTIFINRQWYWSWRRSRSCRSTQDQHHSDHAENFRRAAFI